MKRRRSDKRERIVDAATRLFNRYGFKRTSIDLLATEAGVAKPTIYAYFADKDAVFKAAVEAECADLLSIADRISEAEGPIEERLADMLSAKLTRRFELVHASPHAQELLDSQHRLGADVIARTDRAFLKIVARTIDQEDTLEPSRVDLDARDAAALLVRAASGAAYDAKSVGAHRRNVAEIVRVIVCAMFVEG